MTGIGQSDAWQKDCRRRSLQATNHIVQLRMQCFPFCCPRDATLHNFSTQAFDLCTCAKRTQERIMGPRQCGRHVKVSLSTLHMIYIPCPLPVYVYYICIYIYIYMIQPPAPTAPPISHPQWVCVCCSIQPPRHPPMGTGLLST